MVGIPDHEDPDIGGVMGRVKFEMKDTMLTEYAACLYPRENQEDRIFSDQEKRRKTVFVGGALAVVWLVCYFTPEKDEIKRRGGDKAG